MRLRREITTAFLLVLPACQAGSTDRDAVDEKADRGPSAARASGDEALESDTSTSETGARASSPPTATGAGGDEAPVGPGPTQPGPTDAEPYSCASGGTSTPAGPGIPGTCVGLPQCEDDADCPLPSSGVSSPICGGLFCSLPCAASSECPDDMDCVRDYCAFVTEPAPALPEPVGEYDDDGFVVSCPEGCAVIYGHPYDTDRECFALDQAKGLACSCEPAVGGGGCLLRVDDGSLWDVTGNVFEAQPLAWEGCNNAGAEYRALSCEFAALNCDQMPNSTCSVDAFCELGCGEGRSPYDERACFRASCEADGDCEVDEACVPLPGFSGGVCSTNLEGACGCAVMPLALSIPPHFCLPVAQVSGDGLTPPATARCESTPEGELTLGSGEERRCSMLDVGFEASSAKVGERLIATLAQGFDAATIDVVVAMGADPLASECCVLQHAALRGASLVGTDPEPSVLRLDVSDPMLVDELSRRSDVVELRLVE